LVKPPRGSSTKSRASTVWPMTSHPSLRARLSGS